MSTSPDVVSREKLAACGPAVWGSRGTENTTEAIDSDAAGLWRLLGTRAAQV